jgi:hypothetical protein
MVSRWMRPVNRSPDAETDAAFPGLFRDIGTRVAALVPRSPPLIARLQAARGCARRAAEGDDDGLIWLLYFAVRWRTSDGGRRPETRSHSLCEGERARARGSVIDEWEGGE